MGVDFAFNPQSYQPSYDSSAGRLPSGKYAVTITEITAERTKDQTGGLLKIEFTVQQGTPQAGRKTYSRLNLWNQSDQAKQIAHQQMSALCYCVGINQQISNTDQLKGRNLVVEVVDDGQYSNVTSFLDASGNKPGQAGQAGPPQMQQASGQQQQPQFAQQAPQQQMPQFGAPQGQPNAGPQQFQPQGAPQGGNPFAPPASNPGVAPFMQQQAQQPQQVPQGNGFPQTALPGQAVPWGAQQPQQGQQQPNFGQQAYQPQGAPAQNPAAAFMQQQPQQQAPAGWPGQ